MGRKKVNLVPISDRKSRIPTFKKRKESLIQKMHELTTLCDVSACAIIYSPDAGEPDIWPADAGKVRRIVDLCKPKIKLESGSKTFELSDFFHDRKRRIEEEVAKLQRRNMETRYPTCFNGLDAMSEAELRAWSAFLGDRLEAIQSRIAMLRSLQEGVLGLGKPIGSCSGGEMGMELEAFNVPQNVVFFSSVRSHV